MATAYIALGSNQGDRELQMLRAVAEIGRLPQSRITALSHFYDTDPVGMLDQEPFLNGVLRLETALAPHQLLTELQRIETQVFRRVRQEVNGPRPMDLDILFYDDLVLDSNELTIPHPRLHERRFVLAPLSDITRTLVHPRLGTSIATLLESLPAGQQVRRLTP